MTCRVLVFDDEADIAFMQQTLLSLRGCIVLVVPVEAMDVLEAIHWEDFEAAVVDLVMPRSGADIIEWIAANHSKMRIIIATAAPGYVTDRVRAQADAILVKPFTSDELYAAVHPDGS